jgi:hypothetical protein
MSMLELAVQVVRFVSDEPQPGIVACEFTDVDGRRHTLIDKWPMCSSKLLDANSGYPLPAIIRCEEVARWQDATGREVVQVNLLRPDGIESSEGISEFVVPSTQVSSALSESAQ